MRNEKDSLFSYETFVHAFAGATGSAVAMSVVFPLDTVRTRLQLTNDLPRSVSTLRQLLLLAERDGVTSLYCAALPVLQSLFCSNFVYFYTFHGLRRHLAAVLATSGGHRSTLPLLIDLVTAVLAGCTNVLITNPLWVANTRLKMQYRQAIGEHTLASTKTTTTTTALLSPSSFPASSRSPNSSKSSSSVRCRHWSNTATAAAVTTDTAVSDTTATLVTDTTVTAAADDAAAAATTVTAAAAAAAAVTATAAVTDTTTATATLVTDTTAAAATTVTAAADDAAAAAAATVTDAAAAAAAATTTTAAAADGQIVSVGQSDADGLTCQCQSATSLPAVMKPALAAANGAGTPSLFALSACVRRICASEGWRSLYCGVLPSLLLTANPAIQFVTYEAIKRRCPSRRARSALFVFLAAAFSKTLASILTYPLQMAQAHLRVGGFETKNGKRETRLLKVLALLYRRGGVAGLFGGLEAKLWQTVVTAALMFILYEKIVTFVLSLLTATKRR